MILCPYVLSSQPSCLCLGFQTVGDYFCFCRSDDGRYVGLGGFTEPLHALEVLQQDLGGLGAYTLYAVEFANQCALAAAVAVMGDAEAVRLVAEMLNHPQGLRIFVDI